MGVLADLLANAGTVDTSLPHEAGDRVFSRKIQDIIDRIGDPAYVGSLDVAANEVQTIAQLGGSPSGGNYTLSFSLFGGVTFTTGNIAYNGNAAAIISAIDAVAAPKVPGWTNGDIVVTGGPLSSGGITITFSGASVAHKNHGQTSIDASGVTGGTAGAAATTTHGKPVRTGLAAFYALSLLGGSPPVHGSTTVTALAARGRLPNQLDEDTIRNLAEEAGRESGDDSLASAILTALGY